ncbi:HET-domain-containing protein [Daldinia caldariorum]|uniref:HET-domain-containing protein n=1 Tax=Daldinia caldariorum TaxID=326644 RepID=UPI0020075A44|nr:HET-domain-containing protein [Daldinia caldariorum]KAI1467828.1 HET-domain-containing protein [Daldinia caldariorum]
MAPPDVIPSRQRLCDRCLRLDFMKFFGSKWKYNPDDCLITREYYIPLRMLGGPLKSIDGGVCALCIILSRAVDVSLAGTATKRVQAKNYELRVIAISCSQFSKLFSITNGQPLYLYVGSSTNNQGLKNGNSDSDEKEPRRRGCIVIEDTSRRPEPLLNTYLGSFDAQVVLKWITRCWDLDGTKCCSSSQPIDDLYLIDCRNRTVVAVKGRPAYVALSYVWAPSSNGLVNYRLRHGENCDYLPDNLPLVVTDAMTVTRSLGFCYLWVDKFCIAQDQPAVKHGQIMQMDAVYANSELVIIAAAGQDENYGLPGVSCRPRVVMPTVETKGVRVSWFQEPEGLIEKSKWNTRGWTYQEAFLARRRLVFLDDQMYFECESAFYSDMVEDSWTHRYSTGKSRGGVWRASVIADHLYHFCNTIVGQYTARELSYDSDSLLALGGVLNHFRNADFRFKHVWGIPWDIKDRNCRVLKPQIFTLGLCWSHIRNCWDGPKKPRRRTTILMFPSWAWAGWAGQVRYLTFREEDQYRTRMSAIRIYGMHLENRICDIHLEDLHGNTVALSTVAKSGEIREMLRYPILCIKTWAIPPDRIDLKEGQNGEVRGSLCGCEVDVFLSEGKAELLDKLSKTGGRWRCIFLIIYRDSRGLKIVYTFLILRKEMDQNLWVRVGILQLKDWITKPLFANKDTEAFCKEEFKIK